MGVLSCYVSLSYSSNPNCSKTKQIFLCILKKIGQKCFIFCNFVSVIIFKMTSLLFFFPYRAQKVILAQWYVYFHVLCHLENKFLLKVERRACRQRCPAFLDAHQLLCWKQQADPRRRVSNVLSLLRCISADVVTALDVCAFHQCVLKITL